MPEQQIAIYNEKHEWIARVDMYWKLRKRKIVVELAGQIRYESDRDLFAEKQREDKMRRSGYEVLRAYWSNVTSGEFV